MDYFTIRDSLLSGDILLFRAGTTTAGKVVGLVSRSPFSHVAMVVRYNGELCMWESGRDDLPDVIVQQKLRGVHLVKLDDVLEEYTRSWEGDFVLRRLTPALDEAREAELMQWLPRLSGAPFPELWQIAVDQLEALINPTKFNRDSYACAELIADTYQRVSLLAMDRPAESFSARDFSMSGALSLQFGYALAEAQLVTYKPRDVSDDEWWKSRTGERPSFIRPGRTRVGGITAESVILP